MENPNISVAYAVEQFYTQHDFGEDGGIHEKYAWIQFGFFSLPIPNTESRRNNVYLHDINHIVTGYDTTWQGESSVSAWEIAAGGWQNLYFPWLLTLWAVGMGVLFYPKSVFAAFQRGQTMRNTLVCGLTKDEIFRLSVTDLRLLLNNKNSDKPTNNKNPYVWLSLSFVVFAAPFVFGFLLLGVIWSAFLAIIEGFLGVFHFQGYTLQLVASA